MAKDAKFYASWVRFASARSEGEKLTNLATAEFIENLAAELETVKRERDFLLKYLTDSTFTPCDICKHGVEDESVIDCERIRKVGFPCFEWRGLPEDDE